MVLPASSSASSASSSSTSSASPLFYFGEFAQQLCFEFSARAQLGAASRLALLVRECEGVHDKGHESEASTRAVEAAVLARLSAAAHEHDDDAMEQEQEKASDDDGQQESDESLGDLIGAEAHASLPHARRIAFAQVPRLALFSSCSSVVSCHALVSFFQLFSFLLFASRS